MSNFNSLEKNVARLLSASPALKKFIKYSYSRFVYLYCKKSFKVQSTYNYQSVLKLKEEECFFGYYDKCPIMDNTILMHVSNNKTSKKPKASIPIQVQVIYNGKVIFSIPTSAYNWQQGARAHWVNSDLFILNDYDKKSNTYVSRVFSLSGQKEVKTFKMPVQDSFKTDYFLSLNYSRLLALRPDYGYRNLPMLTNKELNNLEDDGIWKTDFSSGITSLLYPLKKICLCNQKDSFMKAFHKINHIMISPNGEKFIFLHRYYIGKKKYDRLILGDQAGNNLSVLADYGMVSHCYWADNNKVLGFMRGPNFKDSYWTIETSSGKFAPLNNSILASYGDGHPNVYKDWFVTDTYPDKARMQHLILCNWKTGEVKELGSFFHGFEYKGETRCDLHPRFSPDGKKIYFDSVYDGKRRLYTIDI